jgi:hypothetical protein
MEQRAFDEIAIPAARDQQIGMASAQEDELVLQAHDQIGSVRRTKGKHTLGSIEIASREKKRRTY